MEDCVVMSHTRTGPRMMETLWSSWFLPSLIVHPNGDTLPAVTVQIG